MLNETFGTELVQKTKKQLEDYFQVEINGLREYFTLIDAKIAEMY